MEAFFTEVRQRSGLTFDELSCQKGRIYHTTFLWKTVPLPRIRVGYGR